jgi:hypothetical protein
MTAHDRRWIHHRKVILVETGRLVPASDIALGYLDQAWRVAGIDPSPGTLLPIYSTIPFQLRA